MKCNFYLFEQVYIPMQTGTPNACATTDMGHVGIAEYMEEQKLAMWGWIHTHPTQGIFLSDTDMEMQMALQTPVAGQSSTQSNCHLAHSNV